MTPVVVLGGSGLIGAAVANRFRAAGHVVQAPSARELDLVGADAPRRLAELLAAQTLLVVAVRARAVSDPLVLFPQEWVMMRNVVAALERVACRCLYLSSAAVYGEPSSTPVTEETPVAPASPYGLARVTAEGLLQHAVEAAHLLILRPCMVYGPGDRSTAYGPARFARSLLEQGRIELYGDGADRRDYVYVDDVAEIAYRLARQQCSGVYNVASGRSCSFAELAETLRGLAGRPVEVISLPQRRPRSEQHFDLGKLTAALGPFPFVPLADGLRRVVAHG
jgi:UDP-glucose 4-epimerase